MNRLLRLGLLLAVGVLILILATGSSLLEWLAASQATVTINLEVRVHQKSSSPLLTESGAAGIAAGASRVLQDADWTGDVRCGIKLKPSGFAHLPILNAQDLGYINGEQDFLTLFGAPAGAQTGAAANAATSGAKRVRVVAGIYWCGAPMTVAGCAYPDGRIAVTRKSAHLEHILWGHEVGHTKGLPDRKDDASILFVMYETIRREHWQLSEGECTAYKQ